MIPVASDYDFKLGNDHLRGNGWRGLVALGFVLTRRGAIFGLLAISAKPMGAWLLQLLQLVQKLLAT